MSELRYVKSEHQRKPKGVTAKYRAKRKRAESPVASVVRAACVERDGCCRYWRDTFETCFVSVGCFGPSQWSHLWDKQRARTRGMKPEQRHTTAWSVMLCQLHHDQLDGRTRSRLRVTAYTEKGADGPLKWKAC